MKESFIKLLSDVVSSTPMFKPIIKSALIKLGKDQEQRVNLILTKSFFTRLSADFKLIKNQHENLATFLCMDPEKYPDYIMVSKLCKALELFMGNAYLKSVGTKVR